MRQGGRGVSGVGQVIITWLLAISTNPPIAPTLTFLSQNFFRPLNLNAGSLPLKFCAFKIFCLNFAIECK